MKNKRGFIFIIPLILIGLISCGVEKFEPPIKLVTPAMENAIITNSTMIYLTFWGYNKESYFSGYVIYVSTNTNDWYKVLNYDLDTNKITMPLTPNTGGATLYKYWISNNNYISPLTLVSGVRYYFYVRAYSSQYDVYSYPSNITNVVYP